MIELSDYRLTFSFPEVHDDARLVLEFQRTLRIPYPTREMPRLPGLGRYRVYPVAEHAARVPAHWLHHDGAMLPMYQSEAMWISFRPAYSAFHAVFYPFAVQVVVDGVNAVSGHRFRPGLHRWPQDFLEIVDVSWLGGIRTPAHGVRQFVATSLGSGQPRTAVAPAAGGFGELELFVFPMRRRSFDLRYPRDAGFEPLGLGDTAGLTLAGDRERGVREDMLGAQRIEEGLLPPEDWQIDSCRRYHLRLANSLEWCAITGGPPTTTPPRFAGSLWTDSTFPPPCPAGPDRLGASPWDSR